MPSLPRLTGLSNEPSFTRERLVGSETFYNFGVGIMKKRFPSLLMPLDSSRNIGPQRHSSNALGFGSSSSVRPTTFR